MKVASLVAIFRALNEAEVRYIVVGGIAVAAHGYGRNTKDLDIVVNLVPKHVEGAFEALATIGYFPRVPIDARQFSDPVRRRNWRDEKGMLVLNMHSDLHRETPVDIFIEEPFDFAREYDLAKIQEPAPGVKVPIVALDTLLDLKTKAGRPRDIADVAELRQINSYGSKL